MATGCGTGAAPGFGHAEMPGAKAAGSLRSMASIYGLPQVCARIAHDDAAGKAVFHVVGQVALAYQSHGGPGVFKAAGSLDGV